MIAGDHPTRPSPGVVCFVVAAVAASVLVLALGSGLTFFNDEWDLILHRSDWSLDSLFRPTNEHLYAGHILLYKLMLPVFGMDSTLPFRALEAALIVLIAGLVFVQVRSRVGDWPAVIAASLILFLGPAWEVMLWPGPGGFLISIAAGLGALLALDREDDRGDRWACVLLVLAVSFSTLGLVFVAGAAVDVLLRADRRLARSYVPLIPIALFGIWYLAYGHEAERAASLHNLLTAPRFILESAAAVVAALLGLGGGDVNWGPPLLLAALAATVVIAARDPAVLSRRLWVLVAIAGSFWFLAGFNQVEGRGPGASRYLMYGAVPVVLIAAELLRGRSFGRAWLVVASIVAAGAIAGNLPALRGGERVLRADTDRLSAELIALELARGRVDPGFNLGLQVPGAGHAGNITAGAYYAAVDRWGSPVGALSELAGAAETPRVQADTVLFHAYGLHLEPAPPAHDAACTTARPEAGQSLIAVPLPPGGAALDPGPAGVTIRLRRFAELSYPVELGPVSAPSSLAIPTDGSTTPWVAELEGLGRTRICPL